VSLLRGITQRIGSEFSRCRVELEDVTHHADVYRADVAIDGALNSGTFPPESFSFA
jgi:hypothetical protein